MHAALFGCTIRVVQCSHGSKSFIHVVKWPSNGINDLQEEGCCFALFGDSTARELELSAIYWVVYVVHKTGLS